MRHLLNPSILILASLLMLVSGCNSISQPKGNADGYTSFKFYERAPSGDQRFEEPSALKDRVTQQAIRTNLEENGLAYSPDNAELVVSYLFIKQDNVGTQAIPTYYGSDYQEIQSAAHKKGVLKQPDMGYFQRGAIVIDIMDTQARKLIYRDFAVRNLDEATDGDQLASLIESAVAEALAQFVD